MSIFKNCYKPVFSSKKVVNFNLSHKNGLNLACFVLFSGFANLQEQWLERYENENFPSLIQKVWSEELSFPDGQKISLEKFYKQLHAYVRRKLRNFYSDQVKQQSSLEFFLSHFVLFRTMEFIQLNHLFILELLSTLSALLKQEVINYMTDMFQSKTRSHPDRPTRVPKRVFGKTLQKFNFLAICLHLLGEVARLCFDGLSFLFDTSQLAKKVPMETESSNSLGRL